MAKYSSAQLKDMETRELRKLAQSMKIKVLGKRNPDLVREVLKKQAIASGKNTPADPTAASKKGARKVSALQQRRDKASLKASSAEEVEEEEEAVEEAAPAPRRRGRPPKNKVAETAPAAEAEGLGMLKGDITKLANKVVVLEGQMKQVVALLSEMAPVCDVDLPSEWLTESEKKKAPKSKRAKKEPVEVEEDEEDEEEVASDEDDDADDDDDDDEVEVDADDDDEDGEVVNITAEDLEGASLLRLREIAVMINEEVEDSVIDESIKSSKVLRAKIHEFLEENAEKEVDGEEAPTSSKPDWVEVGVAVNAKYDNEWYEGVIEELDVDKGLALIAFESDDSEATFRFKDLKPLD